MTYPTNITDFRSALLAYEPAEDHTEAIYTAQAAASPVVACVATFNALRAVTGLSQDGLSLLLGSAHLIASGGWHGLASEAATLIGKRAADLITPQPALETETPGDPS